MVKKLIKKRKRKVKIEKVHNEVLGTVNKLFLRQKEQIKSSSARKAEAKKLKKYKVTRLTSIAGLKENLDEFEDIDKMLGVVKYLDWSEKELTFMEGEIDKRVAEGSISETKLSKSFDWAQSFKIIDDIKQLVTEVPEGEFKTKADLKASFIVPP